MPGQGQATLDFGAFPGGTDALVAITGQSGITSGSLVEAWIFPADTLDHTADEHWVDPPEVYAGSVVAGVGFTIYGVVKKRSEISSRAREVDAPRIYGKWNIGWVWN